MLSWDNFCSLVEKYSDIVIFRHQNPDGDAYGSQYALAHYLKEKYPSKNIACHQDDDNDLKMHFQFENDIIENNFLAIVVDTANYQRISGDLSLADYIIKIDHHPVVEKYSHDFIIDDQCSSCCQIIANHIMSCDNLMINRTIANYLLSGMISDTLSFSISNVNYQTFLVASYLMKYSDNIDLLNQKMFQQSLFDYQLISFIRSSAVFEKGFAYAIIDKKTVTRLNTTPNNLKRFVNCFRYISGIKIWAIFVEDVDGYAVSIRSDNIIINDVASEFGGGGHKFACASKKMSESQVLSMIDLLKNKLLYN